MNKKLILAISALLSASMLSSCGTESSTHFTANWNPDPAVSGALPGTTESYTYQVSFKEGTGSNANYSLVYKEGSYQTTLSTLSDETNGVYYVYKTQFRIPVAFRYQTETSEYFEDSVDTEVKFKSAKEGLLPISSEKKVVSHSPAGISANKLSSAYILYDYSISINYNENCTSGSPTRINQNTETRLPSLKDFSISNKYSYIDNEQLFFAIRGISTTETFYTYNSSVAAVQKVKATSSTSETTDLDFTLNEVKSVRTFEYTPYTLSISAENSGSSQTLWLANNSYRNMILKIESPLYYGLGTLIYTLTEASTYRIHS